MASQINNRDVLLNFEGSENIEKGVLSTLMKYNSLLDGVADIIDADCFYDFKMKAIYTAIRSLYDQGLSFDLVTLHSTLLATPGNKVEPYELAQVFQYEECSSENLPSNCYMLRRMRDKRKAYLLAMTLMNDCRQMDIDVDESLTRHVHDISEVLDGSQGEQEFQTMEEVVPEVMSMIADNRIDTSLRMGFPTGFKFIDNYGGLAKGSITVLAGRPSHGKSSLALQWALNGARAGWGVAYFTLEMTNEQLTSRALSMESHVSSLDIRSKPLTDAQVSVVKNAGEGMKNQGILERIVFCCRQHNQIDRIVADIRKLHRQGKIQAAFIDYLQQLANNRDNRSEESNIGNNMLELQHLALELKIAIVVLSQLNRQSISSDDSLPRISETRGSGRIEEFADQGFVIYQPAVDGSGRGFPGRYADIKPHNVALVITSKFRNGPAGGHSFLSFDPSCTKFTQLDNPPRVSYNNTASDNKSENKSKVEFGNLFKENFR